METVTLGNTGITVNKNGFGALPVQRVATQDAVRLIDLGNIEHSFAAVALDDLHSR